MRVLRFKAARTTNGFRATAGNPLAGILIFSALLVFAGDSYAQSFPCPQGTFPLVISLWKNDSGNIFGWGPAIGARIKLSSASNAPVATTSNGSNGLDAGVAYFCLAPGQPYSLRTIDLGRELLLRSGSYNQLNGTGQGGTMSVIANYMYATYSVTLEALTEGGQGAPITAIALAGSGCGCSPLSCGQRIDRPITQVELANGTVRFDNVPYGNARFYAQSSDPNFSITQSYIDRHIYSNTTVTFTASSNSIPTIAPTITLTPTHTATKTPTASATFTSSPAAPTSGTPTSTPTAAATYMPTVASINTPTHMPSPENRAPAGTPPLAIPSATAASPRDMSVEPFVSCVSDQGSGAVTAVFGYRNFGHKKLALQSPDTRLIPERPQASLPSQFAPGVHYSAIELAFEETESQLSLQIGKNITTAYRALPCGECGVQLAAASRTLQAASLRMYKQILKRLRAAANRQYASYGISPAGLEINRSQALESHRQILKIVDLSSRRRSPCPQELDCIQTSIAARDKAGKLFREQQKLLKSLTRRIGPNQAGANRPSYPRLALRKLPAQIVGCFDN